MSERHHSHEIRVPKGVLIAAGLLLSATIATVAVYRIAGVEPVAQVPPPTAQHRALDLRFEDGPEGTVSVYQVNDDGPDRIVHVVQAGQGGFIRGVLRSLARARKASGISSEQPFRLIMQADGVLLLEDPATAQRIFLPAFGPTNVQSFREMISGESRVQ